MTKLIWSNPENRRRLHEFLSAFIKRFDFTPETIIEALKEIEKNSDLRPTSRALRNFITGSTIKPSKTAGLDTLTCWLASYVETHDCQELLEHSAFAAIKKIAQTIEISRAPAQKTALSSPDLSTVVALVASLLRADPADFARLEKKIFRPNDERPEKKRFERHFVCYRYHSTPGYIAKSFLVIVGKSPEAPGVCRFSYFSKGTSGGQKESAGIILPFQNSTYFLGHSGDGEGLKIIAIRGFSTNKPIQEGLTLTFDDDSSAIASRIALIDTVHSNSQSAGIGVFRDADLQIEIAQYRSRLRNRIPFILTNRLRLDGKPIDQQSMVVTVAQALKDKRGNSRLTDINGSDFNPAAERHYTYNSVLKIWSDDEDASP
jgi:hypothetical protein